MEKRHPFLAHPFNAIRIILAAFWGERRRGGKVGGKLFHYPQK
jgi:hypothetical protein